MSIDLGNKKKTFEEILLQSFSGNTDAVDAGLYFIGMYDQWDRLSNDLDKETSVILDRSVCQILSGEGATITSAINQLGENILNTKNAIDFYKFITGLLSGEIVTNRFVLENRERIGVAVFQDAMNETSRRMLKGEGKIAANINKWVVLSVIAQITSGADEALRININLKGMFADGN